jgi:hypothetical protein
MTGNAMPLVVKSGCEACSICIDICLRVDVHGLNAFSDIDADCTVTLDTVLRQQHEDAGDM